MNSITFDHTDCDAVIVDLDGTMVDTMGDFVAALNLMLADLKLPGKPQLDRAVVERMVGKGSEHLIESVLNHLLVAVPRPQRAVNSEAFRAQPLFDQAFASYQKHYDAINGQHSLVYPGVQQGLQNLQHAGLKLACLTNKPLAFARQLLKLKGLDGFFAEVFGGDSFERKKPDPLPLLKTCEALRTSPTRTLMLGDSSNDARAARAAGCPVVLVTYGYNHGEPIRAVDADGFVDSLAELRGQK
ncbi:phosphoglycolate phosphatase [Polaromonas sp.]|uniref:phosphoglycolate phosphatase n=1 Tax=Polaromonas sp. TaxID=1869339 RepID=UPI003BA92D1B